jgi:hypothetical protein
MSFRLFILSCWECPSSCLFYPAGHVLPAVYSFVLGISFQLFILSCRACPSGAGNVLPAVYSFVLIHFTDLILDAAFVVSADRILGAAFIVSAPLRCLRCFSGSGKDGSNKLFKVARYVVFNDAIGVDRTDTNDNDINNK